MGCFSLLSYFTFNFFLLLTFFSSYTFSILCNHHDSSALLQFSNSLYVVNTEEFSFGHCSSVSIKTESWKRDTDCCKWEGVTCNNVSGHVTSLDISCSKLKGELHPNSTIFKLKHLQQLNLASNDFGGSTIHSGIGNLLDLKILNLSHAEISGNIPSTISHLSKLVSLDLNGNSMRVDPITWNKLILNATNLRELNLNDVDLSSIKESSLSLLLNLSSSLVSLSLSYTGLEGNFPTCVLSFPNLEELDLSDNKELSGQLPKYNWSNPLKYLDLSWTSFLGEIPNSIGHLKSLNYLSFSICKFHGLIPTSFSNLTQLTYLSLDNNNFTGQIPSSLFHLTQLSTLGLSSNNLQGPIPIEIPKHSQLTQLHLNKNMLNGTIPEWCYSLPSLLDLDLQDNKLTGSIREFSTYSLEYLSLSNNKIHGDFPNSIFRLENLIDFHLSSTNLSGLVEFHRFLMLKKLVRLDLSHNSFLTINFGTSVDFILPNLESFILSSSNIKSFPKFLANLQNLTDLDLSNNKIQEKTPKWFHEKLLHSWKKIRLIDLSFNKLQGDLPIPSNGILYFLVSNNNFSGSISSSLCNATFLTVLNLAHNNLTGNIPQCLGTLPFLSALDVQMNNLHGSIPKSFSEGNSFETIKLNGNRLEGPLPQSLALCTKLEVLDLGDNEVEDTFPTWLETLQELQVLSLRSNKLHGSITCSSIKNSFPKLRIFDVSNNIFSGPLPISCIKNFKAMMNVNDNQTGLQYMDNYYNDSVVVVMKGLNMELTRILTTFTTIDLSKNLFEGEIPQVFGELHSLIGLNLSCNRIKGAIPLSLSNLSNLEWLDLSRNQLTGEIPEALTNLNFLSFLNLSQNQLEGFIPKGKQFDTFGNDSYEGNPMLCGCPLSKSCKNDEERPPHSTFEGKEESWFGWEPVAIGYACGTVFGILLGFNVLSTGKPEWLARIIENMFNTTLRRCNNSKDAAAAADKRFKTLPASESLPRNETIGGYIFVCNNDTVAENLKRQLFGLPPRYRDSVRAITPGLPLFLYNYTTHQLHGIFEAASFGGSNIDPTAWEDKKCYGESRFPAQVRVITRKTCDPLQEDSFRPILHHYDGPKFRLELNVPEALSLLDIFTDQDSFKDSTTSKAIIPSTIIN